MRLDAYLTSEISRDIYIFLSHLKMLRNAAKPIDKRLVEMFDFSFIMVLLKAFHSVVAFCSVQERMKAVDVNDFFTMPLHHKLDSLFVVKNRRSNFEWNTTITRGKRSLNEIRAMRNYVCV